MSLNEAAAQWSASSLPTAPEWAALWSFVLALTGFLALLLARRQLGETRRLRTEEYRAYVHLTVEVGASRTFPELFIAITNSGRTEARNIRFSFNPELRSPWDTDESRVADLAIWRDLPSLVPSQSLRVEWMGMQDAFEDVPPRHQCKITYQSPATHGAEELLTETVLDLEAWRGVRFK